MLDWFKETMFLMPNWAWFVLIVGIACILIAVIIVACVRKGDKSNDAAEPVLMPEEEKAEEKEAAEEPAAAEPEPVLVEEEPIKEEEKKPAEKKTAAKKETTKAAAKTTATAKSTAKVKNEEKTTTKSADKKEQSKTAAKPAAKTAAAKADENDSSDVKVYHISKRKEDKKWQVKAEGADKALRLFFTQTEAIDYAKKVAEKQGGRIVIHKEGGGFRKLNY